MIPAAVSQSLFLHIPNCQCSFWFCFLSYNKSFEKGLVWRLHALALVIVSHRGKCSNILVLRTKFTFEHWCVWVLSLIWTVYTLHGEKLAASWLPGRLELSNLRKQRGVNRTSITRIESHLPELESNSPSSPHSQASEPHIMTIVILHITISVQPVEHAKSFANTWSAACWARKIFANT